MDLTDAMQISASGMRAQGTRLRVISENVANANSTAQTAGGEPFRRKLVTFQNVLDRNLGLDTVRVSRVTPDASDFELKFDPHHPAANSDGYVLMPNVNPLIEITDMREAQRSYDANLNVIETSKSMLMRAIDVIRS